MPDNQVNITHTEASVDNSDTTVVAANDDRKYLWVQNNDAALIVWIRVGGAAAVANEGIRLGPGETFEMSQNKNNVDPRVVQGIASAAGPAVVLVAEA
jgi:hypothetical protein